jgi:hypothetical protein
MIKKTQTVQEIVTEIISEYNEVKNRLTVF